jgi:peptide-methionine (S)-S-oxide reductase
MFIVLGVSTMSADISDRTEKQKAIATFAGGCFWCMEPPFDAEPGVLETIVGYTGGKAENPTYEQVSAGITGHTESIQIHFDPSIVSYERLLDIFWQNIDPIDSEGQFCDKGSQYRSVIFYHNDQQRVLAEASKEKMEDNGVLPGPIVTEIVAASTFYSAEDYHQDFYKKSPIRYKFYRYTCRRDKRLAELWGAS